MLRRDRHARADRSGKRATARRRAAGGYLAEVRVASRGDGRQALRFCRLKEPTIVCA